MTDPAAYRPDLEIMMTEREAALKFNVSVRSIQKERKSGFITYRRMAGKIYYLQSDFDAYNKLARDANIMADQRFEWLKRSAGEEEIWKPVLATSGYEVSSLGRILSLRSGGLIKPTLNKRGYLAVGLMIENGRLSTPVHRVVAEAFIGPLTVGMCVDHIDGNKLNNKASNLQYLTIAENSRKYHSDKKDGKYG